MTQGHEKLAPLHCPRCGGLMRKPAGSTLYWHVDNNHPRCDITNIVETALEVQIAQATEPLPEAPKRQRKK
jgi:ssDNA-binding Zn-finger/Zn-ribbon topoisomerase 1